MTQPDRLAVEDYARRHFTPGHIPYISFAGLVEGILADALTDAQQLAEIRLALAALDLVLAEDAGPLDVSPAQPPYGSEPDCDDEGRLDDDEREAIARESSLRTADMLARFLRGEY